MKIVIIHGPIFSGMMRIMGLETMSIAMFEDPGLIRAIADTMGDFSVKVIENVAGRDSVGGIWLGDDVAYTGGPFISPAILRDYIFTFYRKIGDVCGRYNKLYIYHSDGNLLPVLDDLLECGIQAIHPNECQSVNIVELKKQQGYRVSLIGNVDVDLLSRGKREEIVAATRYLIENVGPGGGFALGSGNSIPDYVPIENYKAMLDTVRQLGAIY
jgi:uroporphyrinogen decarboxylase